MDDPELHGEKVDELAAPLMEAIGHVAHHWARLEHEINQTIWALAAVTPADGACITAQIPSIMPRVRALIALCRNNGCGDPVIKKLNAFARDADELSRKRNRIVHDPWYYRRSSEKTPVEVEYGRLEITANRRLVYEMKPESRKRILDVAHEIIDLIITYRKLRNEVAVDLRKRASLEIGIDLEDLPGSRSQDTDI